MITLHSYPNLTVHTPYIHSFAEPVRLLPMMNYY